MSRYLAPLLSGTTVVRTCITAARDTIVSQVKTESDSVAQRSAKASRRQARELLGHAEEAFAAGDYRSARHHFRAILTTAPGSDTAQEAARALAAFGIDPWAVRAGLFALGLWSIAWALSL